VPILELSILSSTILCALVGGWCIYWSKHTEERPARWGRCGFIGVLLALGALALVAALARSGGLPPLGLVAGLLVVGMLWEGTPEPAPVQSYDETVGGY
jgi:hypothetical protein